MSSRLSSRSGSRRQPLPVARNIFESAIDAVGQQDAGQNLTARGQKRLPVVFHSLPANQCDTPAGSLSRARASRQGRKSLCLIKVAGSSNQASIVRGSHSTRHCSPETLVLPHVIQLLLRHNQVASLYLQPYWHLISEEHSSAAPVAREESRVRHPVLQLLQVAATNHRNNKIEQSPTVFHTQLLLLRRQL